MTTVELQRGLVDDVKLVELSHSSELLTKKIVKCHSEAPHQQAHTHIFNALKKRIEAINEETCEPGDENSFFVCDIGEIDRLYRNWERELPGIQPFYAVKCNPDVQLLQKMASLGANFDCASKAEIEKILSMGISPDRIIYANPCKASSFIRYAAQKNVLKSTFDNVEELHKIKKYHPKSQLLLRISTDDSTAQCRLSTKYGCEMQNVGQLLAAVKKLELNLVGVSFHVGSGASDFSVLHQAIKDAREVFDQACESYGLPALKILDVGGGFQLESFSESSFVLREAINQFFPRETFSDLNIIAEPGRYFAATAFTLAANVIAKRTLNERESMLYINDGVYGNMNCILFDHQEPTPRTLFHNNEFHYHDLDSASKQNTGSKHKVSIWGPTCDGLDCITKEYYMKHDLIAGDWLYFPNLGAYTSSAATPFNGFEQTVDTIYIDSSNQ
ncbi:hypothetical protein HG537_0E02050 [Torulaspora globosa]|uniref:Ornithine decarboxylase n=1 Tax=Torulaspora globosa TaxID=48254 RepID=A0A7H9HU18_9SACH|nr:hypothetical protein HG537_0E02050 [Torulaspora sp. CBS 2947]